MDDYITACLVYTVAYKFGQELHKDGMQTELCEEIVNELVNHFTFANIKKGSTKFEKVVSKGTKTGKSNFLADIHNNFLKQETVAPDWQPYDTANGTYYCTNVLLDGDRRIICDSTGHVFITCDIHNQPIPLNSYDKILLSNKGIAYHE